VTAEKPKPGFFYGWVVVFACFLATLTLGETFWCFNVFFRPLEDEFGWSRAVTGSAYTCFLIGHAISLIIGGRLGDRFSPRPILLGTAVISGTAIALCSRTESVNDLRLFLFIAGLGAGPMWSVSTSTIVRWFSGRREADIALAITTTGVGAGAIIFAPMINRFIESYGWRDAFLYVGIIMAAIVLASAILVKQAPRPKAGPASPAGAVGAAAAPARWGLPARAVIGPFVTVTIIITVAIFSFQAVNSHLAIRANDAGISDASAALAVGLMGGFSIPGRLLSGFISNIVGWRRTLALAVLGMALSIPWLLFLEASWMLYAFVFCYGVCHGLRVPAQIGTLAQSFGLASLGQMVGISTAIGQLVGATAPSVMGFIFDQTGSYSTGFYILMAILTATGIGAFFLKAPSKPAPEPAVT
jgi:OFA family oxalate/formate antiporter-like MFS transporter